ncbi:hypothetical protein [Streptomyces sp. cmx-4-9]|uniref:hypothetical protein n=1 Tax=Streptomyces sp. cmx-4-9 TaxID=2790941 RepID=UPI00397EAE3E
MRLRTTAAVLVGAAALVLPTAAPSLADDHDGRGLGTLHYRFVEDDGDERRAQIRPAGLDTCYLLTHTSRHEPAVEVVNGTRAVAVLFGNTGCSGRPQRVLGPGERARNLEAVAVYFQPADGRDDQGRGDEEGRGDQGRDDQGRGDEEGRGDQGRDDQGRGDEEGRGDQGRDDQGRGEGGRQDSGRPDSAREDAASGGAAPVADEEAGQAGDPFDRFARLAGLTR